MKQSKTIKSYLVLSGLLLSFIGVSSLVMPVEMKATGGIDLSGGNVNALNEARAYSALLFALGLTTITGAFNSKLSYLSTLIPTVVFLSIGSGRLISILSDGMPVESVIKATVLEFILGFVGFYLFQKKKVEASTPLFSSSI
ncbi:DUF4345 domain-containing protein [Flammeovirga sp. SJP92]|uniref:DUF4345 domain-containing protein n=1 Tax=Flammeovirga sp. SJP92 TaxID=1775430 RepID=UPI0007898971|nr:DUF4345 domain-containing protein [Flammeovirga sp. SJP92]KXX69991.1 hypothetical protein AVL50_14030 [Flammeovirga sp. SJP92]